MLWAADASGRLASVTAHQNADPARGATVPSVRDGTGQQVVAVLRTLLRTMLQTRSCAAATYPIRANGLSACVKVEGSPALSPDDGTFTGYIGSVHLVPDLATAEPIDDDLARALLLDAIAEHLTRARSLAVRADERRIVRMLDLALLSVGDRLVGLAED